MRGCITESPKMRNNLVKRGKRTWTIVQELPRDPETGKRQQLWTSVKGNRKFAEKRLAELIRQLDTGGFIKPNKLTLAEFLDQWLRDYAWPLLSPKTASGYQDNIKKHIIPHLGKIPLMQLKPERIQKFCTDELSKGRLDGNGGLSPTSVLHFHQRLHCALESAVKWGLLTRNPADGVDPPRARQYEMNTLDEDSIDTMLEAARPTPHYAIFYMALYSGARRGELLALRWCDCDLLLGQISITRSLCQMRGNTAIFTAPKSPKSRRSINLPPSASLVLREHRQQQEGLCTMIGRVLSDNDLVFSHPDGRPWRPDTITHAWIKLARKVGLRGVRFHDTRHSHASLLLKQGVHPKVVQERLGHASISTTLDIYSHVSPGLQQAAAMGFDELLQAKKNAQVKNKA